MTETDPSPAFAFAMRFVWSLCRAGIEFIIESNTILIRLIQRLPLDFDRKFDQTSCTIFRGLYIIGNL